MLSLKDWQKNKNKKTTLNPWHLPDMFPELVSQPSYFIEILSKHYPAYIHNDHLTSCNNSWRRSCAHIRIPSGVLMWMWSVEGKWHQTYGHQVEVWFQRRSGALGIVGAVVLQTDTLLTEWTCYTKPPHRWAVTSSANAPHLSCDVVQVCAHLWSRLDRHSAGSRRRFLHSGRRAPRHTRSLMKQNKILMLLLKTCSFVPLTRPTCAANCTSSPGVSR